MASGTVWPDGLGRVLPSVVRITLGEAALMEKDAEAVHVVRRRERVSTLHLDGADGVRRVGVDVHAAAFAVVVRHVISHAVSMAGTGSV